MPRKPYKPNSEFPFHVTARCINKEWFRLPIKEVWKIFCDQLFFIHHAFEARLHAFTLMSNHFHLIISTPHANLSEAMAYFMREVSRSITQDSGRINQTFGGRYHRTLLGSYHYYMNAYKYLYRNPVEAGLCNRVEEYKYSTLRGLIGLEKLWIPLEDDTLLFNAQLESQLEWLNTTPNYNHWLDVAKALRKSQFGLRKIKGKPHPLELELL